MNNFLQKHSVFVAMTVGAVVPILAIVPIGITSAITLPEALTTATSGFGAELDLFLWDVSVVYGLGMAPLLCLAGGGLAGFFRSRAMVLAAVATASALITLEGLLPALSGLMPFELLFSAPWFMQAGSITILVFLPLSAMLVAARRSFNPPDQ